MANDVNVSSVDILKGYNSKIKVFNTSINTILFAFRRKIENIIAEKKSNLINDEKYFRKIEERLNNKIGKIEEIISRNNWEGRSLALIQGELERYRSMRQNLNSLMAAVKQDYNTLILQLDQLLQTSTTFAQDNKTLLDSNIARMDNVINHIDNYKSNNIK